jgi:Holliday junction resolvase-like predicted endonuclease
LKYIDESSGYSLVSDGGEIDLVARDAEKTKSSKKLVNFRERKADKGSVMRWETLEKEKLIGKKVECEE